MSDKAQWKIKWKIKQTNGRFGLITNKESIFCALMLNTYYSVNEMPEDVQCIGWMMHSEADCEHMFATLRTELDELEKQAKAAFKKMEQQAVIGKYA